MWRLGLFGVVLTCCGGLRGLREVDDVASAMLISVVAVALASSSAESSCLTLISSSESMLMDSVVDWCMASLISCICW